jgi:hypothetical protein
VRSTTYAETIVSSPENSCADISGSSASRTASLNRRRST